MKIDYYKIDRYGGISKQNIDIRDKKYISHTDDTVTIKGEYIDQYWEEQNREITLFRNFEDVVNKQIKIVSEKQEEYQKKMWILMNSRNYEVYLDLLEKNS